MAWLPAQLRGHANAEDSWRRLPRLKRAPNTRLRKTISSKTSPPPRNTWIQSSPRSNASRRIWPRPNGNSTPRAATSATCAQFRDKARADFDLAVRDNVSKAELAEKQQEFNARKEAVDAAELDVRRSRTARDNAQASVKDLTKGQDDANVALTQAQQGSRPPREGVGQARSRGLLQVQEGVHGVADHRRLQFAAQDHAGLVAQFDDPARHGPHGAVSTAAVPATGRSTALRRATCPASRSGIPAAITSRNGAPEQVPASVRDAPVSGPVFDLAKPASGQ